MDYPSHANFCEFIAAASLYYQSSPSWTVTAISAEIKVFHLRPISITLRGIPIRPSRASLSSSTFLSFLIGLLFFLLEAGYVVESLDDGLDS